METIYTLIVYSVLSTGPLTSTTEIEITGYTSQEQCEAVMAMFQDSIEETSEGVVVEQFVATCVAEPEV